GHEPSDQKDHPAGGQNPFGLKHFSEQKITWSVWDGSRMLARFPIGPVDALFFDARPSDSCGH
ncbi:MAG TPA: hypothetical protein QF700_06130, partial [Prochlorococcus sp.]|nr:hypothetical protein [Prochlorococcus sp.]